MIHKFYAIKDEKSIQSGTIISTFFAIVVSGGCYFLGGFGRLFDTPAIYKEDGGIIYDAIIPSMLSTLPDLLVGIVIVLVLSASMSTLSSLVLTSSSTLTLDFLKDNIIKKMSDKMQLLCMRILLVFFIACSVVLALFPPKSMAQFIAQLMGISWGALAGASGTVSVRLILEGRDTCSSLGQLCLRRGHYGVKPVFVVYCIPD